MCYYSSISLEVLPFILSDPTPTDSVLRGMAGRFLVRYAGMTQREVAKKIGGASGDAVGRQMRKVRQLLETDQRLRVLAGRAGESLDKLRQSMSRPQRKKVLK
jgi:hypothetical protein